MAWKSSSSTHAGLISNLCQGNVITNARVRDTMAAIDRAIFVPDAAVAYEDSPQRWVQFNATISAPHMHAMSLDLLTNHLRPGARVLDIGSGSGYLTCAMAIMVGETGTVVGIEHVAELTTMAISNLSKVPQVPRICTMLAGDCRSGHAALAPYDVIYVGAAIAEVPQAWLEQLAIGGRLLVPVRILCSPFPDISCGSLSHRSIVLCANRGQVGPNGGSQKLLSYIREGPNEFKTVAHSGVRFSSIIDISQQLPDYNARAAFEAAAPIHRRHNEAVRKVLEDRVAEDEVTEDRVAAKLAEAVAAVATSKQKHERLVGALCDRGVITTARVRHAMTAVDRAIFVPDVDIAHDDRPQRFPQFNANVSAPHMHASSLELLANHLRPGARVLDIGSGSGYLTCAMAIMVGETGTVVGIEHVAELTTMAISNLSKVPQVPRICTMLTVDCRAGHAALAPYDVIYVGAAIAEVPQAWLEQLAIGGRLLVPVGPDGGNQKLVSIDRTGQKQYNTTEYSGVRFGSIVDIAQQLPQYDVRAATDAAAAVQQRHNDAVRKVRQDRVAAEAAVKAEEERKRTEALRQQQVAAAKLKAEQEAAAQKKAAEDEKKAQEAAAKRRAEEEAMAKRKREQEAAAKKKADEEAAAKKRAEAEAEQKALEEGRKRQEEQRRLAAKTATVEAALSQLTSAQQLQSLIAMRLALDVARQLVTDYESDVTAQQLVQRLCTAMRQTSSGMIDLAARSLQQAMAAEVVTVDGLSQTMDDVVAALTDEQVSADPALPDLLAQCRMLLSALRLRTQKPSATQWNTEELLLVIRALSRPDSEFELSQEDVVRVETVFRAKKVKGTSIADLDPETLQQMLKGMEKFERTRLYKMLKELLPPSTSSAAAPPAALPAAPSPPPPAPLPPPPTPPTPPPASLPAPTEVPILAQPAMLPKSPSPPPVPADDHAFADAAGSPFAASVRQNHLTGFENV
jgi:protein-L-isoaspartate(D-aspartate) O-methyltransferase